MTIAPSAQRWLIRAAQTLVLAGLVVLLWRAVDMTEAFETLSRANPVWLLAAAAALTVQTALSAQRWRVTARQLGLDISAGAALREYYLAQVVNQALPGGIIGDAGRAIRARGGAGLIVSGQAVVFERIAGQLALLCALLIGLMILWFSPLTGPWPSWLPGTIATILAIAAGIPAACAGAVWLSAPGTNSLRRFLRSFAHAVFGKEVLAQQIALSLGTAACNIAAFVFCARALDVGLPMLATAALVPLILFVMILPLSVSGWGVREMAAVLLFPVIGGTASQGLATSVAFGLVYLVIVLPGALIPLMKHHSVSPKRGALPQMPHDGSP